MSWRTSVELIADRESNDCKHPANGWTKLLFGIWAGTPHVPIMNSGSDRTWRHKSRGPVLIYLFNHRSGIPAQYGIHDGKYAINIPEFRTIYRLEFSNKTSGLELRCVTNVLIIPSPPPSSPPPPLPSWQRWVAAKLWRRSSNSNLNRNESGWNTFIRWQWVFG